jgi:uncharacterized protein YydD (DUF2326 family)
MSNVTVRLEKIMNDTESKIQQLRTKLNRLDSMAPAQRQATVTEIEKGLSDIEVDFGKVAQSLGTLTASNREYFNSEIERNRADCMEIRAQLQGKQQAAANNPTARQGEQVVRNAQRSGAITQDLDEAIRLGNDTITTGNATMTTLIDDRQRLTHIESNLEGIDDEVIEGRTRAKRMLRRALCNSGLRGSCLSSCLLYSGC